MNNAEQKTPEARTGDRWGVVNEGEPTHENPGRIEIRDENGLLVATLGPSQTKDAELIAAAPELLDALEMLQNCIQPDSNGETYYIEGFIQDALDNAWAAIAKAEGR
jgi:hypothetical protein